MTKITGIRRTVEKVEMDVDSFALLEASKEGLSDVHLADLVSHRLLKNLRNSNPELRDRAVFTLISQGETWWMTEDGYDHHKGENIWKSIRRLTPEEQEAFDLIQKLKELMKQLKTQGEK